LYFINGDHDRRIQTLDPVCNITRSFTEKVYKGKTQQFAEKMDLPDILAIMAGQYRKHRR